MAISLSSLRSSRNTNPPITLLYGVDGIGKTSLASEWPSPIYLPTEGERAPSDVDMPTPGTITSLESLFGVFGELLDTDDNRNLTHDFKTVIVDSLDGLEPLIWRTTSARLGIESIEAAGFGKGYVEADTEWNDYLGGVAALSQAGMYVVQLAHPEVIRFDSPITDPYSRYQPKLHKRANALVREKADVVAFMNYRISIKEKEVARQHKVAHAEGGKERQIHLNEGAGFNAKNRMSMPDSITYRKGHGFTELSKFWPSAGAAAASGAAANDNTPAAQQQAA